MRILKISPKSQDDLGREITVGLQRGTSVRKIKLFDPDNKIKDEMLGDLSDIVMVMPVASIRLFEDFHASVPVHVPDTINREKNIHKFCEVKEIFVKDVWHEPVKYNHLISVCEEEILINVDDITFDMVKIGHWADVSAPYVCLMGVKNHFERQIENDLNWIEKLNEMLVKDPRPELNSIRYYDRARRSQDIAVSYLMLDDLPGGRKWFASAAADFLISRTEGAESEGHHVMWALRNAIMSGDRELMKNAAGSAITIEEKFGKQFFLFMKCMANIILENTAEAERIVALFEEWDRESSPRTKRHFEGLAKMCGGIVRGDSGTLKSGLDLALQGHKRKIPSNGRIKDESLVFFQATDLLLLAKDRGLVIKKEYIDQQYREYIPWTLLE